MRDLPRKQCKVISNYPTHSEIEIDQTLFDHRAAVEIGEDIDIVGLENQSEKELNEILVSLYLPNKLFKTVFPVISSCTPK